MTQLPSRRVLPRSILSLAFWLLSLAGLSLLPARAQETQIEFEHLSIEQGLSQSDVNCILEDRSGYVWFGTQDGLNRYDGYAFTVYRHSPSDSNSISDNYITALFEDGGGSLWVGTQNGLDQFDRRTGNFRAFVHDAESGRGLTNNFVSSICADVQGSILVGTMGGGLNRLETATLRFSPVDYDGADSRLPKRDTILALCTDRAGTVWVGTEGGGLVELGGAGKVSRRYRHDPSNRETLSNNTVHSIFEDARGTLWVGTSYGLNRFEPNTRTFRRYALGEDHGSIYSNYIFCVYEDHAAGMWVGTDDGLERYDRNRDSFVRIGGKPGDPGALSDGAIMSMVDAGGVVWFGTKRGLNKYCRFRKEFRNYRHIPYTQNSLGDNKVWAALCDRSGMLWVGSNGGLDRIDRRTGRFTHYRHNPSDPASLSNNSVMAILEDANGTLWLGTWGGGLDRYDRSTGKFRHFRRAAPDSLYSSDNTVVSLCEDGNRALWLATFGGLAVFDLRRERFLGEGELPPSLRPYIHEPVQAVRPGRRDRIWLGTYQGLIEVDAGRGVAATYRHRSGDDASLSDNRVLSIQEGAGDKLLIGTEAGVNILTPAAGTCTRFTSADGLADEIVCGILEDARGNVWLSSNRGISMLNLGTRAIKNYDVADGVQGNEFNEWAAYKSPSGEMFFGGIDGLTSFYPDSLHDNSHVPPIVLTSLNINDREKSPGEFHLPTGTIRLPYRDNNFSFEFSSLDYTRPDKNQYAYMLEGFDKEWVYSGNRRYARYTNIDPGEYTLRLKGSNNDGVWNEAGVAIHFVIIPPYWMTWWFRTGAILLCLSIVSAGYFWRMKTVQERNELLTNTVSSLEQQVAAREQAEQELLAYQERLRSLASDLSMTEERERRRLSAVLHDSIGQTLAFCKLKLGSVQRSTRLAGTDGRLQEILGMIEQSIADTRTLTLELSPPILHELGLVAALGWLCNRMRDQHRIEISLEGDRGPAIADPDMDILLFHAVRELIVNIVKHSSAKRGLVRVTRERESISVLVEDDGGGFDTTAPAGHAAGHDGFGLFSIRERLHSVGGRMEVDSQKGRGTRVRLTVPLLHQVDEKKGPRT